MKSKSEPKFKGDEYKLYQVYAKMSAHDKAVYKIGAAKYIKVAGVGEGRERKRGGKI